MPKKTLYAKDKLEQLDKELDKINAKLEAQRKKYADHARTIFQQYEKDIKKEQQKGRHENRHRTLQLEEAQRMDNEHLKNREKAIEKAQKSIRKLKESISNSLQTPNNHAVQTHITKATEIMQTLQSATKDFKSSNAIKRAFRSKIQAYQIGKEGKKALLTSFEKRVTRKPVPSKDGKPTEGRKWWSRRK